MYERVSDYTYKYKIRRDTKYIGPHTYTTTYAYELTYKCAVPARYFFMTSPVSRSGSTVMKSGCRLGSFDVSSTGREQLLNKLMNNHASCAESPINQQ